MSEELRAKSEVCAVIRKIEFRIIARVTLSL